MDSKTRQAIKQIEEDMSLEYEDCNSIKEVTHTWVNYNNLIQALYRYNFIALKVKGDLSALNNHYLKISGHI